MADNNQNVKFQVLNDAVGVSSFQNQYEMGENQSILTDKLTPELTSGNYQYKTLINSHTNITESSKTNSLLIHAADIYWGDALLKDNNNPSILKAIFDNGGDLHNKLTDGANTWRTIRTSNDILVILQYLLEQVQTLKNQWPTCTITFDRDGGTPQEGIDTAVVNINTEYILPDYDGTRNGYTLATDNGASYWAIVTDPPSDPPIQANNLLKAGDIYKPLDSNPVTLSAVWTSTITFNANGGTEEWNNSSQSKTLTRYAKNGIVLGNINYQGTYTGHTFGGWNTQANGSGDTYDNTTRYYLPNMTLYAKWDPIIQVWNITWNLNGGTSSAIPDTQVTDGDTITIPTPPPTKELNISWNPNGGSGASNDGTNPVSIQFKGWYTARNGGHEVTNNTIPQADSEYYARWDANPNTHNPSTITLPTTDPTRSNYRFDGWYTTANTSGTKIENGDAWPFPITTNTTFYAHWTREYTVTLSITNGSTTSDITQAVPSGSTASWVVTADTGYNLPTTVTNGTISGTTVTSKVITSNTTVTVTCVPAVQDEYYWYVGQTDPSTMTEINPIVTDNSSPGWRLIGTTLPTYTFANPLYNANDNPIVSNPSRNDYWYTAFPSTSSLNIYDSDDVNQVNEGNWIKESNTITISNITYNIYKKSSTSRKFDGLYVH